MKKETTERYFRFITELYHITYGPAFIQINLSELVNKYHLAKTIHPYIRENYLEKSPFAKAYKWIGNQAPTNSDALLIQQYANKQNKKAKERCYKNAKCGEREESLSGVTVPVISDKEFYNLCKLRGITSYIITETTTKTVIL